MVSLIIPQDKSSFWHIRFSEESGNRDEMALEFTHPYKRFAHIAPLPSQKAPPVFENVVSLQECYFLVIPHSIDIPIECKKILNDGNWRKILLKEERVFWQPGKAILQVSESNGCTFFLSLVEFCFYEAELRKLEAEVTINWPLVEKDIALTHQVTASDIKQWGHVNEMTERITWQRMRYVRIRSKLGDIPHSLSNPLKGFVSELGVQADTESRMDSLEDQLEIYEDVYELANDRISEFKYFYSEVKIEIVIIFLLLAEVIIMILELYMLGEQ